MSDTHHRNASQEAASNKGTPHLTREEIEELCAAYVLGAIDDPDELKIIESLIAKDDPTTRGILQEMTSASILLARELPEIEPPVERSADEAQLLSRLKASEREPSMASPTPLRPMLADKPMVESVRRNQTSMRPYFIGLGAFGVLLLAAMVGVLMFGVSPNRETRGVMAAVIKENDSLRTVLQERHRFDSVTHAVFDMLQEQTSRFVILTKVSEQPQRQHIFFSPTRKMVVVMREKLPLLDSTKSYQVWQIAHGAAMSVGVFDIDPKKPQDMYDFPAPSADAEEFKITVEEKGGSPTPKGQLLFAGLVQARDH